MKSLLRTVTPLVIVLLYYLQCSAAEPQTVVVNISGTFSSNPGSIVATPSLGAFPIPSLLGGSFFGSFQYKSNVLGQAFISYSQFATSSAQVQVFNNVGTLIHTINSSIPMRVFDDKTLFFLGSSAPDVPGWLPEMPTDLRFGLFNSSFRALKFFAPSAADMNAATLDVSPIPDGPFIELDDNKDFHDCWALPIANFSLHATVVAVPEPSTLLLAFAALFTLATRPTKQRPTTPGITFAHYKHPEGNR